MLNDFCSFDGQLFVLHEENIKEAVFHHLVQRQDYPFFVIDFGGLFPFGGGCATGARVFRLIPSSGFLCSTFLGSTSRLTSATSSGSYCTFRVTGVICVLLFFLKVTLNIRSSLRSLS